MDIGCSNHSPSKFYSYFCFDSVCSDEFTNTFLFERNRILDVIEDQMREIIDSDRQCLEVQEKLQMAVAEEPAFMNYNPEIRDDAKLKVHIVDAVNLDDGVTYLVRVT